MNSNNKEQKSLQERNNQKSVPEGDQSGDRIEKGYQPKPSQQPEDQNPPSGGSNVRPPQGSTDTSDKKK